ncbi:hypothetical protein R3P38DRAFT_2571576 [Favolaschia claudopus]|uniref:Uncharacterized protein n=1 Tax=Favolaschia claudopus TaxID=2862362 RepID=A0AAV9ZU46_9AGAR
MQLGSTPSSLDLAIDSIRSPEVSSAPPIQSPPLLPVPKPSLRAPKRSKFRKVDDVRRSYGFRNLGEFLATIFFRRVKGEPDPRTKAHRQAVAAFLQGRTTVKMADIIELLYNHHKSRPRRNSERDFGAFSPTIPLSDIPCAKPCLSAWATRLVGNQAYFRVGKLAQKKKNVRSRRRLRASTNGRTPRTEVVEWEDIEFTMVGLAGFGLGNCCLCRRWRTCFLRHA